MLLIGRVLGTNAEYLFPRKTGLDYEATRYLKLLEAHRGRFTVISGMSHRDYPNSHHTEAGLLTGMAPERIQRVDDIRPTISLDQLVAEKIGHQTRFRLRADGCHELADDLQSQRRPRALRTTP